ncbi:hypothetical protein F8M41_011906 [Gigaspora margarita]|uniref:Uncharacterized protein n=1 Tax=Gigaspora margarita TaxID=4874 RepID=A0A8H4ATI9_GIGMA|nr:hypothetical protein F8M41_011906 [Gigaspora margarita]
MMRPWPNYVREKAIRLYHIELDTITSNRPLSTAPLPTTTSFTNRYFASIFQDDYSDNNLVDSELDKYIDIKRVPVVPQETPPLKW